MKFSTQRTSTGILPLICFIFLFISCEVKDIVPALPPETEKPVQTDTLSDDGNNDDKSDHSDDKSDQILIGKGSGQLIIKDVEDKNYKIAPGTYWNITIENVKNIVISGADQVKIVNGDMKISSIDGLTLSSISFENWSQNAIIVSEYAHNLIFKKLKFKNISNSVINFQINEKYDGTSRSFSENIQLIDIYAENVGTLFGSTGGIGKDGFYGLIKGFQLANSTIVNSPNLSNGIYLNLAEDYIISNNVVNNVNSRNNEHNGIFHVIGNGKIFGNKITNHQGNAVRAWLASITKPNSLVEIFDNVVYNSTRYGAFELQVTPWMFNLPTFKPANAIVYNNTAGSLNTGQPKYFEGRLIDLYNTGGTLSVYNNLSFNNRDEQLLNNMSDTKIIRNENNRYFGNASEAVFDLLNFKSRLSNIGAR